MVPSEHATAKSNKTEAALFATMQRLVGMDFIHAIKVADSDIQFSEAVKLLGVTFDTSLSFDQHVTNVVRACNFHLRSLRHLRLSLTLESAKSMATATIGARIDYCNSVLYGTMERNLNRLQKVQNATACTVHQASFQTSVTALHQQLHWLPIRQQITYKLATLTCKAKYCRTPLYLHEQLRDHQVARTLRSTTTPLFYRPFVSTVFASRAFYYSAPQIWNCLGTSTRSANTFSSFRRCLKSELFAAAYNT